MTSRLPSSLGGMMLPQVIGPGSANRSPEMDQLMSLPINASGPSPTPRSNYMNDYGMNNTRGSPAYDRMVSELTDLITPLSLLMAEDSYRYSNSFSLNWKHPASVQKAYQIASTQGRTPDAMDPNPGGMVSWRDPQGKTGGKYVAIIVEDPRYPHMKPNLYGHHMKVIFFMPLNMHTQSKLHKVTECVTYNCNTGMLAVDAHFLGSAILEIALVKMLNEGRISHHDAFRYHMMWRPFIAEEYREAAKMENIYRASTPMTDILERYIMA